MHIQIVREDLLKPLGRVAGAAERRQSLPILSNLLVKVDGSSLTLVGTDLEIEVVARQGVKKAEPGAITVPARKFLEICKAMPAEAKIEIRHDKDKTVIKSGRSRFSLQSLPAADFPSLETTSWTDSFSIPQKELKALLDKTHFCMAQQDVRYYLNGLLLETAEQLLRAVATDGHRLAYSECPLEGAPKIGRQAIVPRKGVQELLRFLEEGDEPAQVQLSTNHMRVNLPDLTFTCKLIDGRFPDYTRVIPSSHPKHIRVARDDLRGMLGRVSILANEKYRGVRFSLQPGLLTVIAHNPEQEEAREELQTDYKGDEMEIGFNASYISDAVAAIRSEEIEIGLTDGNSSCTLNPPGTTTERYVVMPMRL